MGLNVKLYNITNDGPYSIRYKSGPNPYPEHDNTSYTLYGTGLTNPSIVLTGMSFDTQYWVKMTDETTNRYIVKNVYTNDSKTYPCYDTICFDTEVVCETVELSACWYNMLESPDFLRNSFCGGFYGPAITGLTFSGTSMIVNSTEYISTPYAEDVTTSNINWVAANNNVMSGCTGPTGYTYTNFVDFLNNMFSTLGLTNYTAQLSYTSVTADYPSNSVAGFYIIHPSSDTFSMELNSVSPSIQYNNLIYTESTILGFNGMEYVEAGYYKSVCSGITLVDGIVIE